MSLNIELIRASFDQAKPIGPKVVAKFYEILFTDYPQAKPLFAKAHMVQQQKALLNSLVYIVDHIDNEKALYEYLYKMGARHVPYGAKEEHYDWVGGSLLKTFAFFFKDGWTQELNTQWATAFGAIKTMMLEGQKSVPVGPASIRGRAVEICNSLLLEVLENELDDQVVEAIRGKVRETIYACLEEESAELLKKVG